MPQPHRFICPHCHTPIDPTRMEPARHDVQEYRICPECDEAIALVAVAPPERHDPLFVSPDCPRRLNFEQAYRLNFDQVR